MSRRRANVLLLAVSAALVLTEAAPGRGEPCEGGIIDVHGVMRFIDVEGGCWQFEDDSGNRYQPIAGPYFMYCEDVTGRLVGCLRPDMVSTCQVGEIVEVLQFAPDTFEAHGTMRFIQVEGGCWQFLGDDGTPYEPVCGPPEMYRDGAAGLMTAFELCGLGSFCMVGVIVQVVEFVEGDPPCAADLDSSGDVGLADLLGVLGAWGPCPGCPEDLDGDGDVGLGDLLAILGAWGPCG